MFVSVIICTYRRADALGNLLPCLPVQLFRNYEVLIIDGSGDPSPVKDKVREFERLMNVRWMASPKGLTRQRNTGLRAAKGDVICFLDDDVTFDETFLARAVALLESPNMQNVGGITGFDCLTRPGTLNLRWRLRLALGTVPSLRPGDVDRLGRSVPVGFLEPFHGCKPVGYLPGFCMIYRRAAIADLLFDEMLPTYGGEDRDFSFRVGQRWRLLLCGDLHLQHHRAPQSRDNAVQTTYQAGFGLARGIVKNARRWLDYGAVARMLVCEFLVDAMAFVRKPSRERVLMPFARLLGIVAGIRSSRQSGF